MRENRIGKYLIRELERKNTKLFRSITSESSNLKAKKKDGEIENLRRNYKMYKKKEIKGIETESNLEKNGSEGGKALETRQESRERRRKLGANMVWYL